DLSQEVDVVDGQAEDLALAQSTSRAQVDRDPVPLTHRGADSAHQVSRPGDDLADVGTRRPYRAGPARILDDEFVIHGRVEDRGHMSEQTTPVRRGHAGLLQPAIPGPDRRGLDLVQRTRAEYRIDMHPQAHLRRFPRRLLEGLRCEPLLRVLPELDLSCVWIDVGALDLVRLDAGEPSFGLLLLLVGERLGPFLAVGVDVP